MAANKTSDFNEDFVPLSYAATEKKPVNPAKPTVRRMSLREFSGLEDVPKAMNVPRHNSAAYHEHTGSPLLGRLHGANNAIVAASSRSTETLNYDQCGSRRRSSSALYRPGSNFGSREYVYEPFDKVIEEISMVVQEMDSLNEEEKITPDLAAGHLNLNDQLRNIEEASKRLNAMLEKIPTQSPKRRQPVEVERNQILANISRLSSASKRLVRSVYSSITPQERSLNANSVLLHANLIVSACEKLLEKRNTYYQAHLLKAELDQLLKTLGETLKDVEEAYDKPRYGPELKRVSRSSNALAASLAQTQRAVQNF